MAALDPKPDNITDMKVYLDNVICSGLARGDLSPQDQMKAACALVSARDRGEIELVTSAESWREQDRTKDATQRAIIVAERDGIPRLNEDHKVRGFFNVTDHLGGLVANPMVTDVVDATLLAKLESIKLPHADRFHLMYAVHNDCRWFVTMDTRDLLLHKAEIEALCPSLKVVTPVELATELKLSW
jgi:predicted nucleic acid-binding protein